LVLLTKLINRAARSPDPTFPSNRWLLNYANFRTLHENRQHVAVTPNDFDAITQTVDEHEVIAKPSVAFESGLNDC